ncbi:PspA/IM30 family protein [Domibacillus mangrovi]|uniref:Modulator protein n=1 Tax=Domibacillus mangrovi TaxID=1714354 RepID=A0A1Q5P6I5_9BACI|nr:PspA/IM30 family protein [Domibacillus mangrovi]OKL37702.1 modulator protein [Domibacillus mangrovi]
MNLFTRIKQSISADLHHMLDRKEQQNPIAALNHYLRQSEQEKDKVRTLIDRQYRLKEEFAREYRHAKELADKRLEQASIAKKAGEEELHTFAMKEYEDYQSRTERMKVLVEESAQQLEALEGKYEEMKHKLKDMHVRRMELMGRENVARTTYRLNKVIADGSGKQSSRFTEMEQYIDGLERNVNQSYEHHTFDSKMAKFDKDRPVDDQAEAY